jgi:hypothetical protein
MSVRRGACHVFTLSMGSPAIDSTSVRFDSVQVTAVLDRIVACRDNEHPASRRTPIDIMFREVAHEQQQLLQLLTHMTLCGAFIRPGRYGVLQMPIKVTEHRLEYWIASIFIMATKRELKIHDVLDSILAPQTSDRVPDAVIHVHSPVLLVLAREVRSSDPTLMHSRRAAFMNLVRTQERSTSQLTRKVSCIPIAGYPWNKRLSLYGYRGVRGKPLNPYQVCRQHTSALVHIEFERSAAAETSTQAMHSQKCTRHGNRRIGCGSDMRRGSLQAPERRHET